MDVDRLFLETLDDLERRAVRGASEYDLLRSAALLRELLIDEHPLVHQVNRARHVRLRFSVRRADAVVAEMRVWLGISPADAVDASGPTGTLVEVGLKDFLAEPMVFLPTSRLTVHDLITLGSNVLGGIHHGAPRHIPHQQLIDYPVKIHHGRVPIELECLVPVVAVLLAGIEPLRERVRAELPDLPPDPGGRVTVTTTRP